MCGEKQHHLGVSQIGSLDRKGSHLFEGSAAKQLETGSDATERIGTEKGATNKKLQAVAPVISEPTPPPPVVKPAPVSSPSKSQHFRGRHFEPSQKHRYEGVPTPPQKKKTPPEIVTAEVVPEPNVVTEPTPDVVQEVTANAVDNTVSAEKPISTGDPARDAYFRHLRERLRLEGRIPKDREKK